MKKMLNSCQRLSDRVTEAFASLGAGVTKEYVGEATRQPRVKSSQ